MLIINFLLFSSLRSPNSSRAAPIALFVSLGSISTAPVIIATQRARGCSSSSWTHTGRTKSRAAVQRSTCPGRPASRAVWPLRGPRTHLSNARPQGPSVFAIQSSWSGLCLRGRHARLKLCQQSQFEHEPPRPSPVQFADHLDKAAVCVPSQSLAHVTPAALAFTATISPGVHHILCRAIATITKQQQPIAEHTVGVEEHREDGQRAGGASHGGRLEQWRVRGQGKSVTGGGGGH